MNLVNMFEDAGDVAVFEIDNERAYEQVMDKFGHIIEWSGDFMVAPRNVFTQIEQVAHDAGGAANEITDDMFEATGLTFMGSPCTKDCSGHKAGYEWSEKRGGQNANSHSQSFNNGAAISVNAKNKQQQPAQQTKPQTAADKLRAKMADLLGPDKAKTFGLAEGSDMCKVCGQTPCNCTSISEGYANDGYGYKSLTTAQIMKLIQSGNWEAMADIVPGKHLQLRNTRNNKNTTIHVKQGVAEDEVSKKDIAVSKKKIDAKRKELEKQGVKKSQLGEPSYYLDAELRNANKQGVAEGTQSNNTPPTFVSYVYSKLRSDFSDYSEVEDLFDYAYLSDLDLLTIADGADEEGISALKWMTPRMAWLLKNINDKSYLPVIKPLAVAWMKTVAPAIDKYVKDVLNDLDEGLAEADDHADLLVLADRHEKTGRWEWSQGNFEGAKQHYAKANALRDRVKKEQGVTEGATESTLSKTKFTDVNEWRATAKSMGYDVQYGYDGAAAWLDGKMMGEWIPREYTHTNLATGWLLVDKEQGVAEAVNLDEDYQLAAAKKHAKAAEVAKQKGDTKAYHQSMLDYHANMMTHYFLNSRYDEGEKHESAMDRHEEILNQLDKQGVAEGSGPENKMTVGQALEIAKKNNSSFTEKDYYDLIIRNEGLGSSFFNSEVMSAIQKKQGVAEGKFNELSVMIADYHNSNITDVKFYGMYGKTRQQVAKEYANYLEEGLGDEFGQKELKHTIARARAKFPRAASDTEALIMYVQDQEQQDVRKLDQVNDREDKEIDRLEQEDDSIEQRLQNVERKVGMMESRLYYTVVGTVDSKLRSEFGLRKDKNGWYLKESADPKIKYSVYKAFGSPKLKEYDLTANRGTAGTLTGAENPVSPVGSVPRGQQKTRR